MNRPGYIYLIKADTGHYKIGRSNNVPDRMKLFAVKLPFDFEIIHTFPCGDMFEAETILHGICAESRVNGEWFDLQDNQINLLIDRLGQYDYFSQRNQDKDEALSNVTVTIL